MIDHDILSDNLEQMIRSEPFVKVDLLIGVTADEALYFAEEHIFNYYLPREYPSRKSSKASSRASSRKSLPTSFDDDRFDDTTFFKRNEYIKTYLQTNYPNYLCSYNEVQARYMPDIDHQTNLTAMARQYTNLMR